MDSALPEDDMALDMDDAATRHPASYPFLLIDKVMGMDAGVRAVGLRNVTCNDPLLAGGGRRPLTMRRALLVEAFAQLTAMALGEDSRHPADVEVACINSMSFTTTPTPGDQIVLTVELAAEGDNTRAACKAEAGGATIAGGSIVVTKLPEA